MKGDWLCRCAPPSNVVASRFLRCWPCDTAFSADRLVENETRTAQALDDLASCAEPSDDTEVTIADAVTGEVNDDVVTLGELLRDNAHDAETTALLLDWTGRGCIGDLVIPQFGGSGARVTIGAPDRTVKLSEADARGVAAFLASWSDRIDNLNLPTWAAFEKERDAYYVAQGQFMDQCPHPSYVHGGSMGNVCSVCGAQDLAQSERVDGVPVTK